MAAASLRLMKRGEALYSINPIKSGFSKITSATLSACFIPQTLIFIPLIAPVFCLDNAHLKVAV
jgi:hypothetical protein